MERTEKLKTVKIKGKEYTEVNERILFLAKNFDYEIDTDFKFYENQKMWVVKAILKMHSDQGCRIYTGVAQEIIGDGYINKTSALENCETSAVGRACAMAGIGVIESIASVNEINKTVKDISTRLKEVTTKVELMSIWKELDEGQQMEYRESFAKKIKSFQP